MLPDRKINALDRPGDVLEELVIEADSLCQFEVAHDQVSVVPGIVLLGGGLDTEEADLGGVAGERAVTQQQLDIPVPYRAVGQCRNHLEEPVGEAGRLDIGEHLDLDRRVALTEAVTELELPAEDPLGVVAAFDDPEFVAGFAGRHADDRNAQHDDAEQQQADHAEAPGPPGGSVRNGSCVAQPATDL